MTSARRNRKRRMPYACHAPKSMPSKWRMRTGLTGLRIVHVAGVDTNIKDRKGALFNAEPIPTYHMTTNPWRRYPIKDKSKPTVLLYGDDLGSSRKKFRSRAACAACAACTRAEYSSWSHATSHDVESTNIARLASDWVGTIPQYRPPSRETCPPPPPPPPGTACPFSFSERGLQTRR